MFGRVRTFAEEIAGAARLMNATLRYDPKADEAIFRDGHGKVVKVQVARLRVIHGNLLIKGVAPTLAPLLTVQTAVAEALTAHLTPFEPRVRPEDRPDHLLSRMTETTAQRERERAAEHAWVRERFRLPVPQRAGAQIYLDDDPTPVAMFETLDFDGYVRGPFKVDNTWDAVVEGHLVTVSGRMVARAMTDFGTHNPQWGTIIAATFFLRGQGLIR